LRRGFRQPEVAGVAKGLFAEVPFVAVKNSHSNSSFTLAEGKFHGICKPPCAIWSDYESVDNHLDPRSDTTGQLNGLVQLQDRTIDPNPDKSFPPQPAENILWPAEVVSRQRCKDENPGALWKF
jgi:hypothetical protein